MKIDALSSANSADWLEFFDQRAFADHAGWQGCYCTFYFQPKPEAFGTRRAKKRDYAVWLIEQGIMRGYLAYEENHVVGWCNANDRTQFGRIAPPPAAEKEKILSIVCFLVQKEFRHRGIATALLERAISDAQRDGYSAVEAYPQRDSKSEFRNYHGPYAMYARLGFMEVGAQAQPIVRRSL